jgi:hypothetical protein
MDAAIERLDCLIDFLCQGIGADVGLPLDGAWNEMAVGIDGDLDGGVSELLLHADELTPLLQ